MTKSNILLIEDELVLAEIVQESLQSRGFKVYHVDTVENALKAYYQIKPDIMVLDIMLPDGDGFSFARQFRNIDLEVPIIFLTSRSQPHDVVMGFESGGNDYLKKPFSIEELIVRIRALLSRDGLVLKSNQQQSKLGNYHFDYPNNLLAIADHKKTLTARESEILQLLVVNKSLIVGRKQLLINFWGNDDYFSGRSLDVFITKLRKYLKEDPSVNILNIRGQGYKLVC